MPHNMPEEKIVCVACRAEFMGRMPSLEPLNERMFSMIVATHETPLTCPACGIRLLPVIERVNITWGLVPMQFTEEAPQQQSSLILPGNDHKN